MIEALVIVKTPGALHRDGRGEHKFDVVPRIGDHIELNELEDDDSVGYFYRVVTVVHPESPTGFTDIYAVQIGKSVDVLMAIFASN